MARPVQGLAHLALGLFFPFVRAAVPLLFAFGQGDFAFGPAVAKVKPQRNDGLSFLPVLPASLSISSRRSSSLRVRSAEWLKGPPGKYSPMWQLISQIFSGANGGVRVAQIRLPFAQRFNLGAEQHHFRLVLLTQMVIVRSGAVLSD